LIERARLFPQFGTNNNFALSPFMFALIVQTTRLALEWFQDSIKTTFSMPLELKYIHFFKALASKVMQHFI
jgi:hypothetical protein